MHQKSNSTIRKYLFLFRGNWCYRCHYYPCHRISSLSAKSINIPMMLKASFWFQKAAVNCDARGQYYFALSYFEGKRRFKDYKQAFYWFKQAAEQGDSQAQGRLGDFYATGKGVQQNKKEANRWLKKAVDRGDDYAQRRLKEINVASNSLRGSVEI